MNIDIIPVPMEISIPFAVLGTVCNITSIIVLSRSALSRLKIRSYLIALAVFDLLCLWSPLLYAIRVINHTTTLTDMQCKLYVYYFNFVMGCSSWIAVAINVERLLYVVRPFRVRPQRGTAITLSLITSLVAVINIPIANGSTAVNTRCSVTNICSIFHYTICSYIPAVIMIVSTIIHTYTLCRRPKLVSNTSTRQNKNIRILVAINLMFLCTSFPASIALVVAPMSYWPHMWLIVLYYANSALNFVLYTIAGQIFREELKAMCCAKSVFCRKSDTYSSSTAKTPEPVPQSDTQV